MDYDSLWWGLLIIVCALLFFYSLFIVQQLLLGVIGVCLIVLTALLARLMRVVERSVIE